jgi:putative membrane protein
MAEDRTSMANERTFSSWMGTGLGVIGVAIGMKAVFGAFKPTWAAKAIASISLIIAILTFYEACQQACKTVNRLRETVFEAKSGKSFTSLEVPMSITAIGTGAIL